MSQMEQQIDLVQEFFNAIGNGEIPKLEEMLAQNPDLLSSVMQSGYSPVLTAAYNGRQQSVDFLLQQGIPLNVFEAAAVGDLQRVQELVEKDGSLVHAFARDGFTALGLASFFSHADVVRHLLQQGADVNIASQNSMKVMPLHSAVAARNLALATLLLEHGAQVNAQQESGFTPLHEAALQGNEEMVKFLLTHGADVQLRDDKGQTPLDVAVARQKNDVAQLLAAQ